MINKILISVLQLSIAGSITYFIFLLGKLWIFCNTTANFMVKVYTILVISFIIPIFYSWGVYDNTYEVFSQGYGLIMVEKNSLEESFYHIIKNKLFISVVQILWLTGIFFYLFYASYRFFKLKKGLKYHFFSIYGMTEWQKILNEIREEENIKEISLLATTYISQPCTTGIFQNTIFIPAVILNQCNTEEIRMILCHEVRHNKRKDVPLKTLIQILNCINWFNPLFYIIKNELYSLTELACDEEILFDCSLQQRKAYANILLHFSREEKISKSIWNIAGFGENKKKLLNRRLKAVMEKKNHKKIYHVLTMGFLAFAVASGTKVAKAADTTLNNLFSTQTEIAYEDEISILDDDELQKYYFSDHYIDFDDTELMQKIENGEAEPFLFTSEQNVTYKLVSEDNTVEILQDSTNAEIEPKHTHTWKSKNITEHKKYSDGSCKTTVYAAKYCTDCGYTVKGDIVDEVTHKVCPH